MRGATARLGPRPTPLAQPKLLAASEGQPCPLQRVTLEAAGTRQQEGAAGLGLFQMTAFKSKRRVKAKPGKVTEGWLKDQRSASAPGSSCCLFKRDTYTVISRKCGTRDA